jgi:hypothetical protein
MVVLCARTMMTKLCAAWLLILAVLPFTAPFATFDLTDTASRPCGESLLASVTPPVSAPGQDNEQSGDTSSLDVWICRVHSSDLCGLVPVASPAASDDVGSFEAAVSRRGAVFAAYCAFPLTTVLRV